MENDLNKPENPQDKVMGKPSFVPKKQETQVASSRNITNQNNRPKRTSNNSVAIWIFFGIFLFLFIALLVISVYMLQTNGGEKIFSAFGVSVLNAQNILRNIINGLYIFFAILLLIMLLIGAGIISSTDKKSPLKKTGIHAMIFSIFFIFILGISYISIFQILYKTMTPNQAEDKFANYIQVTPNPPTGSAPLQVFFDATKIDEVNEDLFYEWDFGDDTEYGTGPKTSHSYKKTGIYSVKLTISNAEDTQEIATGITVLIHNEATIPKIVTDVTEGKAPLNVHFDASTSQDPNGEIISYIWDFGDKDSTNNQAKGTQAVHTYTKTGNYNVTLTTTDDNGENKTITQSILVTSDDVGITPKVVASPLSGPSPLKVTFNASGSTHTDENRSLMLFEWDFGDGSELIKARETSHTFRKDGIYEVILTITDDDGNTKQEITEITVSEKLLTPEAKIIPTPAILVGPAPFAISLDGMTSLDNDGEVVSYKWSFGDDTPQEVGPQITHTYKEPGNYTITLEVVDNDGKRGSTSTIAVVKEKDPSAPTAKVKTNPTPPQGDIPFIVTFDASESKDEDGHILSYLWNFGDNSKNIQTTSPTTTHKYETIGIWPATVTVFDNDNLSSVANVTIAVNASAPKAKMITNRKSGYAPIQITFDASESNGIITKYSWDFGDNTSDAGIVAKHTFKKKGTYNVTLDIEDAQGQVDTDTVTIIVK